MHIALLDTASGFNPSDPVWGFWLNLAALILAIVGPPSIVPQIVHFFKKPGKQLSYQTESDAALIDQQKDLGEDITVFFQGGVLQKPTPMNDARLIMFKIINTGSEIIHKEDFFYDEQPILRFQFADAKLLLCAIHHTEPDYLIPVKSRKSVIHVNPVTASLPSPSPSSPIILPRSIQTTNRDRVSFHEYVDLDGRTLEKGNAIVLKFVTQGRVEMKLEGGLLGGKIVPYAPSLPVFTVPRILLGVLVTLLLVLPLIGFGAFHQNDCALSFSPVRIGGSSAFNQTVQDEAATYHQGCPFGPLAALDILPGDSGAGLLDLEQNRLDIAASEISPQQAGDTFHDLLEHQVAVIVFTMIVSPDVKITSLTQDDIINIYTGQYKNWNQVPGLNLPDLPIVLFGRSSDSGTQATFTHYVLQDATSISSNNLSDTQEMIHRVSSTRGAIGYADLGSANKASDAVTAINIGGNAPTSGLIENNAYPFWAIERMYTKQGANNPLMSAFITYITDKLQTNTTFIRIGDMQQSVLAKHE